MAGFGCPLSAAWAEGRPGQKGGRAWLQCLAGVCSGEQRSVAGCSPGRAGRGGDRWPVGAWTLTRLLGRGEVGAPVCAGCVQLAPWSAGGGQGPQGPGGRQQFPLSRRGGGRWGPRSARHCLCVSAQSGWDPAVAGREGRGPPPADWPQRVVVLGEVGLHSPQGEEAGWLCPPGAPGGARVVGGGKIAPLDGTTEAVRRRGRVGALRTCVALAPCAALWGSPTWESTGQGP